MLHSSTKLYESSIIPLPLPRVHNKRREGEYPTITIPCTNVLRKVRSVNHRVLLFCINTFRETNDLLIGANSVVLGIVDTR